jgi:hypothetical protein
MIKTLARPVSPEESVSENNTPDDMAEKTPQFLRAAGELPDDAESVLRTLRVIYSVRSDGKYIVDGNLDISGRNLDELPDLRQVIVFGKFICTENNLKTLSRAPREALEYITDFGQFLWWQRIPKELRD